METNTKQYIEPTYKPTANQLARDQELRRRTRLYIYLPLGIACFLATMIIVLIFIGLIAPGITGTVAFIAALADIIIILWIVPMIAVMSILPIGYLAYLVNRRNKRKLNPQTGPLAYRSRIQVLLWRVQYLIEKTESKTNEIAPKVAEPVTRFNGLLAYLESWLILLTRPFRGNDNNDGN